MKCCPGDKDINREWVCRLESESRSICRDKIVEVSNFCKALSHPLRVNIALLLCRRDLCVCEIVSTLREKQNLVSHHLSIMKKYHVVSSYTQAKYRYYRIEDTAAEFLGSMEKGKQVQDPIKVIYK